MNGTKLISACAAAAAVPVVPSPDIHWANIDIGLGIPFNVIVWIIVGAAAGVWGKRMQNKGNLSGMFLYSFIMTVVVVVFAPEWMGYQWKDSGVQAAAGVGLSFTSQTWGPELVKWAKSWINARRQTNAE